MLLDTANGPPPPGSLLESVLILVVQRRQKADILRTRVVVEAILAQTVKSVRFDQTFQELVDTVLPYLKVVQAREEQSAKDVLKEWSQQRLAVRPLWQANRSSSLMSKLRRGAERLKATELERKAQKLGSK